MKRSKHGFARNISNTRDSVSSGYTNTEKRVENTTRSGAFFDEIRGVWIANETLSRVFDISSQSKLKLKSKRKNNTVETYANEDHISEPPSGF